jgi:hypothetical protein
MTNTPDEFDAVRTVTQALEGFGAEEQKRILRWAAEKLGIAPLLLATGSGTSANAPAPPAGVQAAALEQTGATGPVDIKSFVAQKKPKSDVQFAAVIAYYHQFEAKESERKGSINVELLVDACRKASYPRPPAPAQTLRNAVNAGLLDRTDRGEFSINSVGENLVAMTLSGEGGLAPESATRKKKAQARNGKSPAKKK